MPDAAFEKWENANIGAPVIVAGAIPGILTALLLHENYVRYRVAWFDGATRHCEWLESGEVDFNVPEERTKMGFVTAEEETQDEDDSELLDFDI